MPPLNEGDLLYMPTTLPGVSPQKAKELLQETDRIIASFPEVESVFGKIGRAETATDPAPLSMIETTVILKPMSQWREGLTMQKLIREMDQATQIPGPDEPVDDAHQDAHRHAGNGHQNAGRRQDRRRGPAGAGADRQRD